MDLFASDKRVSVFVCINEVFSQDFYACLLRVSVCLTGFLPQALCSVLSAAARSGWLSASPSPPYAPWIQRCTEMVANRCFTFYIKHNLKGFSVFSSHLKCKVKCNYFWVFCVMKSMKWPPHIKINLLLLKQQLSGLKKQTSVACQWHMKLAPKWIICHRLSC